ncbi:MAG: hypothetical protein DME01_03880 [Candidatus Rokuibacteriota bacterium]|nr:MAG: hypothetical protein DME01_03880 [Candidatus Rokubacteria bacterium]
MKIPALAALVLILTSRSVLACATCIASPFGDQAYTWPYLGLILLPFGLMAAIAGILGYLSLKERLGFRPRTIVRRLVAHVAAQDDPQIIKETT